MATERVQLIIDAAERVAMGIRDDAEAQARQYVEDAKRRAEELTSDRIRLISETSDSLLEQARRVKAQSEELLYALQDAAAKITAAASDVPATVEPPRTAALDRTPPVQAREEPRANGDSPATQAASEGDSPPPTDERDRGGPAEDPWLLATRMAVAGSSRDQIDRRLREIGVDDPRPILDGVLSST